MVLAGGMILCIALCYLRVFGEGTLDMLLTSCAIVMRMLVFVVDEKSQKAIGFMIFLTVMALLMKEYVWWEGSAAAGWDQEIS